MNGSGDDAGRFAGCGLTSSLPARMTEVTRLMHQARLDEAEQILREVLALHPHDGPAALLFVRLLLAGKRIDEACAFMQSFVAATAQLPAGLLLLHAQTLLALARLPEAITAFARAVAAEPANAVAELGLAVALGRRGDCDASSSAARRAIAKGADHAGAHFVLAHALFDGGHYEEAEKEFRRVLRLQPTHVPAHANLANLVWMRSGDLIAATAELDGTLREAPQLAELRIVKSRLLDAAGDSEGSYAELIAGLRMRDDDPNLHVAAAQVAVKIDPSRALAHAERAVQGAPRNADALGALADALLGAGQAQQLVAVTGRLLHANPHDGHALALRACAWRMLGDSRYREMYDYARFVQATPLDTPQGWPDLPAYLTDLGRALHRRHGLRAHPVHQSARHGSQVELHLEHAPEPAIRAFTQAIDGPVRCYLAALGGGQDVLRARNSGAYRLNGAWSVRLRSGGHHVDHFHGKGWLSSACYVDLPATLGARGGEGWLRFGEPGVPTAPVMAAEYFVRPQAGLLVLFPSWMWHGTVAFSGSGQDSRLSIAFDVVPA